MKRLLAAIFFVAVVVAILAALPNLLTAVGVIVISAAVLGLLAFLFKVATGA